MTGKLNIKLHRAKVRSGASVSPARSQTSEENSSTAPDLSLLRKSIRTSVTGFAQARDVFDAGTSELKQLLSTECDIIYECRVCRNLFRSLANFISHKRIYCCEKFNSSLHPFFSNNNYMKEDLGTIIEHEEDFQDFLRSKDKSIQKQKSGLESENLGKKNVATKDLTSIIERLLNRTESENSSSNNHSDPEFPDKHHAKFQLIPDTKNAVYQNIYTDKLVPQDLIKDQVAELDRLISSNEAVLGPDGKLLNRDATSTSSSHCNGISKTKENKTVNGTSHDDLFCSICKINFSTQKTLKFHMKNKHAENRLVYPCPDCTDTFSNSWSVFRHLFKVHRKSTTHIRKHRESIQNKAYPINTTTLNTEKRKVIETVRDTISEQQRMDQENQAWIDNLEGDGDIPRCGGCGKRFERRAALSSHRQTCQLRKTAQNRINTNVQRRLMAKALNKESDDTLLPEPVLKIPKIDKPAEKKIEIKIRRDYNKSNPLSIRTSSPAIADEDTAMETTEHNGTSNLSSRIEREHTRGDYKTLGGNGPIAAKGTTVDSEKLSGSSADDIAAGRIAGKSVDESETIDDDAEEHPSVLSESISSPRRSDEHSKDRPGEIVSDDRRSDIVASWGSGEDSSSFENIQDETCATAFHSFEDIREIIFGQNSTEHWNADQSEINGFAEENGEKRVELPIGNSKEEDNSRFTDIANKNSKDDDV